jgi:general secretion pathway protein E
MTADEALVLNVDRKDYPLIKRGAGCERCGGTGYRGRVGLYELLMLSDEIRHLITSGADANVIRRQAEQEGMLTLREDALAKLRDGITTPEEVVRVTRAI